MTVLDLIGELKMVFSVRDDLNWRTEWKRHVEEYERLALYT